MSVSTAKTSNVAAAELIIPPKQIIHDKKPISYQTLLLGAGKDSALEDRRTERAYI